MIDIEEYSIPYKENGDAIPLAFSKDAISICFCTSNKYATYCGITIQSIIENSSEQNFYDIFVLEHDISDRNKRLLLSLIQNRLNFSIRFVNMKQGMKNIKVSTWAHFSPVACFKLFLMSNMFSSYKKMLALDTDLIFTRDAGELYSTQLNDYYMAAVDDVIMKEHVANHKNSSGFAPLMSVSDYISEYLGFGTDEHYYNTGVALINLQKCREMELFSKAFYKLKNKGYSYQEQDVLNELFANQILSLDYRWNVVGTEQSREIVKVIPQEDAEAYRIALEDPYVIHFAGGFKPWIYNNAPYSEFFYQYAKNTPWYETILASMTINYANFIRNQVLNTLRQEQTFRAKVKKLFRRLFPLGTTRGKVLRKLFPRGKGIRERIRLLYVKTIDLRQVQKQRNREYRKHLTVRDAYVPYLACPLHDQDVLLDSKNGTDLAGNIFRIIEELSKPEYKRIKLFLTYTEEGKERIVKILAHYGLLDKVTLIKWRSKKYFRYLARSKYLVTDLYMPPEYTKRQGQILVSTAHGTPIKVMGRDCHTETQGDLQRTHTLADYQTFPSNYMKEKLFHAFMEDHLYTGHALKSGYCRNDVFFNKERRATVRTELKLNGKRVYAYLPTFRGIAGGFHSRKQIDDVMDFCSELDTKLSDNEIFLVKMHNFNKEAFSFDEFKHISPFPDGFEVYDVLNATDVLISDYSSVFFDYANTGNKIILFQYDLEEYLGERGVYLSWEDLPFPVVATIDELYNELQKPKEYDDAAFLNQYCTYDSANTTRKVCQTIFRGIPTCEEFANEQRKKKNIFLYAGNFDLRSPQTFYLREYLKRFDLEKNNYFIYFYEYDLFSRAYMLEDVPIQAQYFSFAEYSVYPWLERQRWKKHHYEKMKKEMKLGCQKCFGGLPIDLFVNFCKDNAFVFQTSEYLPCPKIVVEHVLQESDEILVEKQNVNTVRLPGGYSAEILDQNAATLERIFNK